MCVYEVEHRLRRHLCFGIFGKRDRHRLWSLVREHLLIDLGLAIPLGSMCFYSIF
jgi:hypothetical protein